jgi:hypothetical protein
MSTPLHDVGMMLCAAPNAGGHLLRRRSQLAGSNGAGTLSLPRPYCPPTARPAPRESLDPALAWRQHEQEVETSMATIEHITITTGVTRMSPRSEVDDDVVRHIAAALAGRSACRLGGTGWLVRLLPAPPGAHVYDLLHDKCGTIARCWLCLDRQVSDDLWNAATASVPNAHVPPPLGLPWLAAAITADLSRLVSAPELLVEADDLERCVAWALIEAASHA